MRKLKTSEECEKYFEEVCEDYRELDVANKNVTRNEILDLEYENIKDENKLNDIEDDLYEHWLSQENLKA